MGGFAGISADGDGRDGALGREFVDVIGLEEAAAPLSQLLMLRVGRIAHGVEEVLEAGKAGLGLDPVRRCGLEPVVGQEPGRRRPELHAVAERARHPRSGRELAQRVVDGGAQRVEDPAPEVRPSQSVAGHATAVEQLSRPA